MSTLPITGEYPPDWPEIGDRVRAGAGHRCVRCGHPYETGKHGKGEWSPCDANCVHWGPIGLISGDGQIVPCTPRVMAGQMTRDGHHVAAQWRILTVHHFDGNKSNCRWYNLMALCQRCHLQVQTKVDPEIPYFLEHSEWAKPYVAGFYAAKYLGMPDITREEVAARMDELLALERLA